MYNPKAETPKQQNDATPFNGRGYVGAAFDLINACSKAKEQQNNDQNQKSPHPTNDLINNTINNLSKLDEKQANTTIKVGAAVAITFVGTGFLIYVCGKAVDNYNDAKSKLIAERYNRAVNVLKTMNGANYIPTAQEVENLVNTMTDRENRERMCTIS